MDVLIADDDAGTRLLVSAAVEQLGHRCTVAEDGSEAWRRYQELLPDVVITDWQMPGMDGTELAEAIRGLPGAPYAYVVVLTGAADEDAARRTMEVGADDLLLKPLDVAQLERKLIVAGRVTALHRRMHDDARQDTLTGLGNRLRLAEDLEALCGRVARYGHVYSAALFDIDGFKGYNDGAGHLAGDDVLRRVAARARAADPHRRRALPLRRRGVPRAAARAADRRRRAGRRAAAGRRRGARAAASGRRRGDGERRRGRAGRRRLQARRAVRARRPGALPRQGGRPQPGRAAPGRRRRRGRRSAC